MDRRAFLSVGSALLVGLMRVRRLYVRRVILEASGEIVRRLPTLIRWEWY